MDNYFSKEIIIIVYDSDKDSFRIFTFDRNNNYLIVLFKCETIILYAPLGSIYILVLYIVENVEIEFIYNICSKGTWA